MSFTSHLFTLSSSGTAEVRVCGFGRCAQRRSAVVGEAIAPSSRWRWRPPRRRSIASATRTAPRSPNASSSTRTRSPSSRTPVRYVYNLQVDSLVTCFDTSCQSISQERVTRHITVVDIVSIHQAIVSHRGDHFCVFLTTDENYT